MWPQNIIFTHTNQRNVATRMPKGFQEFLAENLQALLLCEI